ncbi:type I-E CRISPR-associated protein Cas5/CasD [Saccharopolyspora endophytica]|uniref:Type I-E CRISPR-associated protein Cas5/CasD n=1 Tax=Saccharopolyspora endophytica TaxID=543886 RepID=A0ABS5D9S8_9PSEU|nr:type I-E CRISPR-associated protein Cas5/CasD [Saccharopolyspora endophytica]MBQ0923046.1 type I-E CRISPR-associated protein Cas5/CasD [Saccharopolyspora endophytica]
MSGLLLRLAGPLQSWGERSKFDRRDTAGFPTRSGLLGLIACALGRARGQSVDDLADLSFTIRVDRPGTRIVDYHTVGGGLSGGLKVPTADGKGRPPGKGILQTWREYLADAVFVVAVEGPEPLLDTVEAALHSPHWQPYLGRRSCPPEQPLVLGRSNDPQGELRTAVPVARRLRSENNDEQLAVDFVCDSGPEDQVRSEIFDVPDRFDRIDRTYQPRPVWIETTTLPTTLAAASTREHFQQLADYVRGGR